MCILVTVTAFAVYCYNLTILLYRNMCGIAKLLTLTMGIILQCFKKQQNMLTLCEHILFPKLMRTELLLITFQSHNTIVSILNYFGIINLFSQTLNHQRYHNKKFEFPVHILVGLIDRRTKNSHSLFV